GCPLSYTSQSKTSKNAGHPGNLSLPVIFVSCGFKPFLEGSRMKTLVTRIVALSVIGFALPASAQLIDFETTPTATTPSDDAFLSLPYNLTGGGTVSFFFDGNANFLFDSASERPVFEHIGTDGNDGFSN